MKLIIAEKKNVAEAIASAFGTGNMKNGFYETNDYIITWASGHLLELYDPEEIDPKYKEWKLEDLPIPFNENTPLKPKKYDLTKVEKKEDKEKLENSQKAIDRQLSIIKKYLCDNSITEIIHAGDPDPEGQLLIDNLINYFNCKKPVMRVLINDNNPNKIKEAFTKLQPNSNFKGLSNSAKARTIADKYLGMNGSRFFSLVSKVKNFKLGRVKSPVLGLIVMRYLEVINHVKSYYYTLEAEIIVPKKSNSEEREEYKKIVETYEKEFTNEKKRKELLKKLTYEYDRLNIDVKLKFSLISPKEISEDNKIIDRSLLENLKKEIKGFHDLEISKDILKKEAPLPFNLIELQQYANKKWNYTGDDVMKITQNLRDKYKAITYNRSDCQYLSVEHYKEAPIVISQILNNLNITVPSIDYNRKSKCFNDEFITAHHGIIPTNTNVDLTKLTDKERNIYKVIADYYICQFLPPLISEKTTGEIKILDEIILKSISYKVLDYGYKVFLNEKLEDEISNQNTSLSALYSGIYSQVEIKETNILEKETTPKKLYTEATLLKDMTSISKYVTDPILRKALKDKDRGKKGENGGIGTPATRSPIIKDLFKDGYVILKDNKFIPTELGIKIYEYLAPEVKTANVTAEWWLIQAEIEECTSNPIKLLNKVEEDFLNIMSRKYVEMDYKANDDVKSILPCPKCGKKIYESKISYFCEGYKDNPKCDFNIWKENKYLGIKISKEQLIKLMEGKIIIVKREKYKIDPSGNLKKETNKLSCPKCRIGEIKESPRAYNCSSECGFIFWKNEAITYNQFKQLVEGKSLEIKGLKNKSGEKYNAKIKIKEDYTGFLIVK